MTLSHLIVFPSEWEASGLAASGLALLSEAAACCSLTVCVWEWRAVDIKALKQKQERIKASQLINKLLNNSSD